MGLSYKELVTRFFLAERVQVPPLDYAKGMDDAEKELLIAPAHIRKRSGRFLASLIVGVIISSAAVIIWAGKLSAAEILPLFAIFATSSIFFVTAVEGKGYGPLTDVIGDHKWLRGMDVSTAGTEEPEDIVRTLYQFSSYSSIKTSWPIVTFFAMFGALALGSVLSSSSSWPVCVFASFLTILLAHAYTDGFHKCHGETQAQMYRDSLYCGYRSSLAWRAGRSGAATVCKATGEGAVPLHRHKK